MRLPAGFGLLLLALVAAFSLTSPARAWTKTVVHSARATVDVESEGSVYVLLRLDVEVHAGWLQELELVDLGDEVDLDRHRPPYFRSEEGRVFRPEAELGEDGRIRLWFERRDAPRRGKYRVYMRYRTRADVAAVDVGGQKRARLTWSMPAWETGLHDVLIEFRAPKGTRLSGAWTHDSPGTSVEVTDGPRRAVVRVRRIHVPRMTAWPIALEVPEGAIAVPKGDPPAPIPSAFQPLPRDDSRPIAWVTFAILALALLKRGLVERRHGRSQLLVRAPWWFVVGAAAVLATAAQLLAPTELGWGFASILLALHRPFDQPLPRHRNWKRSSLGTDMPRLAIDLLDATNALGALMLVACAAGFVAAGVPTGALLLLPLFFTGTRWHRPPTSSEANERLVPFVDALRLPADAPPMALSYERADDGATRVRIELTSARAGLSSVSFVGAASRVGTIWKRRVMLLVHTRAQSDADDLMRRRKPTDHTFRTVDGSVLRLVEWNEQSIGLLRRLAGRAPEAADASPGRWLLRELSNTDKKAA